MSSRFSLKKVVYSALCGSALFGFSAVADAPKNLPEKAAPAVKLAHDVEIEGPNGEIDFRMGHHHHRRVLVRAGHYETFHRWVPGFTDEFGIYHDGYYVTDRRWVPDEFQDEFIP